MAACKCSKELNGHVSSRRRISRLSALKITVSGRYKVVKIDGGIVAKGLLPAL